jgi:hypothetical protein
MTEKSEVGGQTTEVRDRRSEVGGQRTSVEGLSLTV